VLAGRLAKMMNIEHREFFTAHQGRAQKKPDKYRTPMQVTIPSLCRQAGASRVFR